MGAAVLLKKKHEGKVPPEVAGEVEDTARWLLCDGAEGLKELACRGLQQVAA
jgi:hypothetical protein